MRGRCWKNDQEVEDLRDGGDDDGEEEGEDDNNCLTRMMMSIVHAA